MANWHAWEDGAGGALFIADGPRHPVLVMVRDRGAQENVLATFVDVEMALSFQEWIDDAFTETASANDRLMSHIKELYRVAEHGPAT